MKRNVFTAWILLPLLMVGCFLCRVSSAQETALPRPELVPQTGHTGEVHSVAFSPNGKLLASGSEDNTVKLWSVADGREVRNFAGHSRGVKSITFSPDGKLLASGSLDGTVKLWSVADGREVRTVRGLSNGPCSIAFSPDGKFLASTSGANSVKLWSVADGREVRTFEGQTKAVLSVAFSPDGKLLAAGSLDSTVKLWSVADAHEVRTFTGHRVWVYSLAFSPDGKLVMSQGVDGTVKLWSVADGREVLSLMYITSTGRPSFSPDGKLLASGSRDDTIKLWNVADGREVRTFAGRNIGVHSVAFSPDGKFLASASRSNTVKLWDVADGREVLRITGYWRPVYCVAFSPDSKFLASGSTDNTVKLWNVADGRKMLSLIGHKEIVRSLSFSPDGKFLASGSDDKTVRIWDVADGREVQSLSGHNHGVKSVAFSPDRKLLASGSDDKTVKLWNIADGREVLVVPHGDIVMALAFSPDGKLLASGSFDGKVKLWNVADGREVRTLTGHTRIVYCVAFSPDGKLLASGSNDKTVKLWNVADGREVRTLTGHTSTARSIAFTPDGKLLVSGSDDKTVKLWNVADGREVRTLTGRSEDIFSVALSPDGRICVAASYLSITISDVLSGTQLLTMFSLTKKNDWLALTPDGLFDGSDAGIQSLAAWRVGNRVYPPDRFFASYYRPGLVKEIFSGERPKASIDIAKLKLPPDVAVTSPSNYSTVDDSRISVAAECADQGGGLKEVRLYHNGKLVQTQKGNDGAKTSFAFDVDLVPDRNVLGVKALSNQDVESNLEEVTITHRTPQVPKPNLHLLLVGINRYQDPRFDLKFARVDAESIANFFQMRGSQLFASVIPTVLPDEKATKQGIMDALDRVTRDTKPEDVLFIYLAGHGVGLGEQFYFLTRDMREEENEAEAYRKYGISATALGDALYRAHALKQVLILDTCESEAALPALTKLAFFKARGPTEDKALKMLGRSRGIYLIAASTQMQRAYEVKQLGHGILTYVLLDGLGEKGPPGAEINGMVTVGSLTTYVNQQVPELTEQYLKGKKQYPVTTTTGMDFPLAVR